MQKHQVNEMLLGLGALCVTGNEGGKNKAVKDVSACRYAAFSTPCQWDPSLKPNRLSVSQTGNKKNKRQKPKKKKKDRNTIEESIRRVRSLSNSPSLASS